MEKTPEELRTENEQLKKDKADLRKAYDSLKEKMKHVKDLLDLQISWLDVLTSRKTLEKARDTLRYL